MDEILKALKEAQDAFAAAKTGADEAVKAQATRIDELVKQVSDMVEAGKTTRTELNDVLKKVAELLNPNNPSHSQGVTKTLGEMFVTSEVFKGVDFSKANAMASVNVGTILKAITSATALPDKTRLNAINLATPDIDTFLYPRLAQGTMVGGSLEYIRDTTDYGGAGWLKSTAPTAEGVLKPEAGMTMELLSITPKTIAHWIQASKQILADQPALRSFIDGRLLFGLRRKLEYQVVNGSGVGQNMEGLMTAAANAGAITVGHTPYDTVRVNIGVVEAIGYQVDTVGINPVDWAAMQIIKGDDGHYVYFNPANSTTHAPVWGKPVVPSPEVPLGKFLIGAFAIGAQLFEREGASVQVGFQNDDFTKNLVTILAEMRAALAIYADGAFRRGDLY